MNSLPFNRDKKKPSFQSQSSFPSSFENKIKDITPQKSSFPSSLGHAAPSFSSNIKKNRPSFSSSIEKNRPSFSSNIEKNRPVFKSTLDKKISAFATNPSDKKVIEVKHRVSILNSSFKKWWYWLIVCNLYDLNWCNSIAPTAFWKWFTLQERKRSDERTIRFLSRPIKTPRTIKTTRSIKTTKELTIPKL